MIFAPSKAEIEKRRKVSLVKWQLKCEAVAGSRPRPTVLPNAGTPPMLFWVLMAAGQVVMRKTGGRPYLNQLPPNSLTSRPAKALSDQTDLQVRGCCS
jgi:hypothetical protein